MIGIIDYGAGNLRSVTLAIERCGCDVCIVHTPEQLQAVCALVLPGVGSFNMAMQTLQAAGWDQAIRDQVSNGKKLLGICLGMQLLFEYGSEDGPSSGLGLIPGRVVPIEATFGNRIPHMGWNSVVWQCNHPVMTGIRSGLDFYHVHSYHCLPDNPSDILALTPYGSDLITAVANNQVVGFQFHPEKSQPAGLKLLQNFLDWAISC